VLGAIGMCDKDIFQMEDLHTLEGHNFHGT
jgi:hypothetical protein